MTVQMQFFFYEIVARIVALYLFVDTIRELRHGLAERKIRWINPNLIPFLLLPNGIRSLIERDTSPIQFWVQIGVRILVLAGLMHHVYLLIFGWYALELRRDAK